MKWLRTDEYQEVKQTLRACSSFVRRTKRDATYWKWFFIALHNAVQGCMVIALTRTDGFGAIPDELERKWLEAERLGTKLPEEKLLPFLDLYAKIKKKNTIRSSSAERFVPRGSQGKSVKKLNSVRNDFIHFTPKGWSLELSGAPKIGTDCLEVAEFLVVHSTRFRVFKSFKEGELLALIEQVKKELRSQAIQTPQKQT